MSDEYPQYPLWEHLATLRNQIATLLYIYGSGYEEIGEDRLAKISGLHPETCRHNLQTLAEYGYVKRTGRYNGYSLTSLAYQILPRRQPAAPPAPESDPADQPAPAGKKEAAVPLPAPADPSPSHHHAAEPARQPASGNLQRDNSALADPAPSHHHAADPARQPASGHLQRDNSALAEPAPSHHHAADPARQPASGDLQRGESALPTSQREDSALAPDGVNDRDSGFFYSYSNISSPPLTTSPGKSQVAHTGAAGARVEPAAGARNASPVPGKGYPDEDDPVEDDQVEDDLDEDEEEVAPRSPEEIEAARRLLRALGIGEPTRSQLLELEWVTEEYILEWRKCLDDYPGAGKWKAGLLILRLRLQEWPPEPDAYTSRRQSYSSGEFADFIEP